VLALTDQALARIVIAASAIPRTRRGPWLQDLAKRLEPPKSIRHVREHRLRARNGIRKMLVSISLDDEELLRHMGLLGEWDAEDRAKVGAAIERLLALLRHDHGL
jgi:hypothetical protein